MYTLPQPFVKNHLIHVVANYICIISSATLHIVNYVVCVFYYC